MSLRKFGAAIATSLVLATAANAQNTTPPAIQAVFDLTRADVLEACKFNPEVMKMHNIECEVSKDGGLTWEPWVLGGLGTLALGAGGYMYRRREKKNKQDERDNVGTDTTKNKDGDDSIWESTGAHTAVDAGTSEIDPVAEAEVYIQYGRDRHAKDILIDAMRAKEYPDEKTVDMYIILMGIYTRIGNELERQKELDNIKYLKSKGYALTNAQDTKIQDILNIVISKKATV